MRNTILKKEIKRISKNTYSIKATAIKCRTIKKTDIEEKTDSKRYRIKTEPTFARILKMNPVKKIDNKTYRMKKSIIPKMTKKRKRQMKEITEKALEKIAIKADFHTLFPWMYETNEEEKNGV